MSQFRKIPHSLSSCHVNVPISLCFELVSLYRSNIFHGGEDIWLDKIISPDFHANLNEQTWVCYYHVDVALNGIEV